LRHRTGFEVLAGLVANDIASSGPRRRGPNCSSGTLPIRAALAPRYLGWTRLGVGRATLDVAAGREPGSGRFDLDQAVGHSTTLTQAPMASSRLQLQTLDESVACLAVFPAPATLTRPRRPRPPAMGGPPGVGPGDRRCFIAARGTAGRNWWIAPAFVTRGVCGPSRWVVIPPGPRL